MSKFRDEISKGLECSICMAMLHEPKVLQCHHWFCKTCIDELVEFNIDGCAIINCPMKCKIHTFIESTQTTDDLPIPYQLTSLLDVFEQNKRSDDEETEVNPKTCSISSRNCKTKVSLYCGSCSEMMCNSCSQEHNDSFHDNEKLFLPIQFDKKSEKVMVVCNEHSTFAKYICCKNKFICMYCKNRSHRLHEHTCIQLEADQVREFLCSDEIDIDNLENGIQNTIKMLNATQSSVDHSREMLELSLKNLKIKRMTEFSMLLDKAESDILSEYDTLVKDHKKQFPDVITKDYFKDIMKMSDVEIITMREKIMKNIFSYTSTELSFPSVEITFSESNNFLKNLLGKLKQETMSPIICNGLNISTFNSKIKLYDNSEIATDFESQLKRIVTDLIVENNKYMENHPNSLIAGTLDKSMTNVLRAGNSSKSGTSTELSTDSNYSLDEFELDETFDSLKEQLCESVDLQFGSLLKAIQDQFIITEGLDIEDDNNSEDLDEEEDDDAEESGDMNNTDGPSEEESREDIEQSCNQS